MHRRPLTARFNQSVIDEIKCTTIRNKPWPIGAPIMFYNWSGAAYRSKQIEVTAIEVIATTPIRIGLSDNRELIFYHAETGITPRGKRLWQCEGFLSQQDMDLWFKPLIKPGQTIEKHLNHFRLHHP